MTGSTSKVYVLSCLAFSAFAAAAMAADAARSDKRPALEISRDTMLDPAKTYGSIVIKASHITVDGRGAWIVGATEGNPKDYQGVGVSASGISDVTLKNVNVNGWNVGLRIDHGSRWTIESCNFSDNFHHPEAGWGELGHRGGIVFEYVDHSTLRKNKANRVWDACMLSGSNDNRLEENDFSHASNTCLSLWTACRNRVVKNNLSWGIRIKPGEVHARDSACVLVQAGSDDNYFADNDITHGGDGVFIRPFAGWTSSGNVFERNDASYANNNCIEAQCPRNTYRRNKANHGSHGIWVGWSNETVLEENEACYNGLASGMHNAPWEFKYVPGGPKPGAAGIIMAGSCDHTVCRGNQCIGNNGAGISMFGDNSPQHAYKAFHWVLQGNVIRDNRWGIYMEFADWIDIAGNTLENNRDGNIIRGGTTTNIVVRPDNPGITRPPEVKLVAPAPARPGEPVSVKLGQTFTMDASGTTDPGGNPLSFRWDFTDGSVACGPRVEHAFAKAGPHSVGMTATNGCLSNLAYRDFLAYEAVTEWGTEGQAARWIWEEVQGRDRLHVERNHVTEVGPAVPVDNPQTKLELLDDREIRLVGDASLALRVEPSGNPIRLLYPRTKDAGVPLAGKTELTFWVKMTNPNIHAWKGLMPTVTFYESPTRYCELRPYDDPKNWQGGIGWIYKSVPLHGGPVWKIQGAVPATLNYVSIEFYPWGDGPFRAWIDGMAIK
jgi:parallel beta-helix repeat protein